MAVSYWYLLAFRLVNALLIRTYFTPDEQWQSLEVAHKWVFGYGDLTWEWEPCIALRGVMHPAIFALLYKVLHEMSVDTPWLVAYAPRLLQGAAAALADHAVHKAALFGFGSEVANWALLAQLASWFQFYTLPRTYSSAMEAVAMALAIEHWLSRKLRPRAMSLALIFGSVAVVCRPTAALFWVFLVAQEMFEILSLPEKSLPTRVHMLTFKLLVPGFTISGIILAAATALDTWYFNTGVVILAPLNFVRFNLFNGGSAFYGGHAWYWYFTEGLGVTLLTLLPLFVKGLHLVQQVPRNRALLAPTIAAGGAISVLSFAAHKEYRLLLPFLPLTSLLCGLALAHWAESWPRRRFRCMYVFVFAVQLLAAIFFSLVHQRGAEQVLSHLRSTPIGSSGVFFLTPCHATPLHSYLHQDVPMGYLDCSPGNANVRDRYFKQPGNTTRQLFPHSLGMDVLETIAAREVDVGTPAISPISPCLAARFKILPRELPDVFVVWGSLISRVPELKRWLALNSYVLNVTINDGFWTEGPYDLELWPTMVIFKQLGHNS